MTFGWRKGVGFVAPLLSLFLFALPSWACSVPVFRYALENWPVDPYQVTLFHRGPLPPTDEALAATLEKAAADRSEPPLTLRRVDLAQEIDAEMQTLLAAEQPVQGPWLVVRYPAVTRNRARVWSGPLNEGAVRSLLDSPLRREIARRILGGDSAVWVLLRSGNPAKDDAARDLVQAQLKDLQRTLKLPEQTDAPEDRLANEALPLRLAFSLVELGRDDPAEQVLVRMLLHSESDLPEINEPMLFPVFGRGRALYALVGKGITGENVAEAARFLIGPCSCKVKKENPGTDLLLALDWKARLAKGPDKEPTPAPASGLSDLVAAAAEEQAPVEAAPVKSSVAGPISSLPVIVVVPAVVVVVTAGFLLGLLRRRRCP
jgi:hypothetical protein